MEGGTGLPGHWRGPEGQHCYQWVEWQEAAALKGVGSEAQADHVHVINAGPGVVAAVRNETKILNLFPKSAPAPHPNKRREKTYEKIMENSAPMKERFNLYIYLEEEERRCLMEKCCLLT